MTLGRWWDDGITICQAPRSPTSNLSYFMRAPRWWLFFQMCQPILNPFGVCTLCCKMLIAFFRYTSSTSKKKKKSNFIAATFVNQILTEWGNFSLTVDLHLKSVHQKPHLSTESQLEQFISAFSSTTGKLTMKQSKQVAIVYSVVKPNLFKYWRQQLLSPVLCKGRSRKPDKSHPSISEQRIWDSQEIIIIQQELSRSTGAN